MKTRTIKLPVETKDHCLSFGGYSSDSSIFKMTQEEFVADCGGRLAVALFEGKFKTELWHIIAWAQGRGAKNHHARLLREE